MSPSCEHFVAHCVSTSQHKLLTSITKNQLCTSMCKIIKIPSMKTPAKSDYAQESTYICKTYH